MIMMPLPKPIGFGWPKASASTTLQHDSSPITHLGIKEIVETSEPEPQPSMPLPATIYELNDILHNTRLLIDFYKSKHPDPESHVDLRVLSRSRPLTYFIAFKNGEERRLLGQLAELGQELHELRMQRQEDELAWLRHEAMRGLPSKDQEDSGTATASAGYHTAETQHTFGTYHTADSHYSDEACYADSTIESRISAIEPSNEEKANTMPMELDDTAFCPTIREIEQMVDSEDERITCRFFTRRPIALPNITSDLPSPSSTMESFWEHIDSDGPVRLSDSGPAMTHARVSPVTPLLLPVPRPVEAASSASVISSNEADMSAFSTSFPCSCSITDSSIYRQQDFERRLFATQAGSTTPEHLPPRGPRQWLAVEAATQKREAAMIAQRGVSQWLAAQAALQNRMGF